MEEGEEKKMTIDMSPDGELLRTMALRARNSSDVEILESLRFLLANGGGAIEFTDDQGRSVRHEIKVQKREKPQ